MDKKYIVFGLVAVVIVAGAAVAAYLILDDDDDSDVPVNYDGRLMIYGNATNDDYLDEDDLDFIESIVSGDAAWDRSKNPYADANNDGSVDAADVEFVKRLINREPMMIWYHDDKYGPSEIKYPLKNIAVMGNTQLIRVQALDIIDRVQGISGTGLSFDNVLHKTVSEKPRISTSTLKLDLAMYSEVSQMIPGGFDAVYCSEKVPQNDDFLLKNGLPMMHLEGITVDGEMRTYLTLGYLTQAEERSHELVEFMDDVYRQVNEKISTIPESERVTGTFDFGPAMGTIGGALRPNTHSGTDRMYMAGLVNNVTEADLGGPSKSINKGDVWQLSDKFQADINVASLTGIGYQTSIQQLADLWNDRFLNPEFSMTKMDAYPNFIIMSHDACGAVYVPYLAEYLYPDLFEEGFAVNIHQEWGDRFFVDLQGFDASKVNVLVGYEDVKPYL